MLAAGAWILGMTGVLIPVLIIGYGLGQQKKGPLLRYRVKDDVLELPRLKKKVSSARERVKFNLEEYRYPNRHIFELNLVIDGSREPFIGAIASDFRKITQALERHGLVVR